MIDTFIHVPLVRLEGALSAPLGEGTLIVPTFDQWSELEDVWLHEQERRYARAAPVFLHRRFETDDAGAVTRVLADDVERLSLSLLVVLMDPRLQLLDSSVTYLAHRSTGVYERRFGPCERELLLGDHEPLAVIDAEDAALLGRVFERLTSIDAGAATPELLRVADAFRLLSRPGTPIGDVIVLFVAAQEDLLNTGARAKMGKLSETFARRAARLYASNDETLPVFERLFRALYTARSGVLHGRSIDRDVETLDASLQGGLLRSLHGLTVKSCSMLAQLKHRHGAVEGPLAELLNRADALGPDITASCAHLHEGRSLDWLYAT